MRSISKIKSAVDKRDNERYIISPSITVEKAPRTARNLKNSDEVGVTRQTEEQALTGKLAALQKAVGKGNKDLNQIRDEIIQKTEKSINAGGEIIDAAKKRANSIAKDARVDRGKAKVILGKAEKQGQELDEFKKKLDKTKEEIDIIQKNVSNTLKDTNKTLKVAKEKDKKSSKKLNQSQETLNSMLTLLLVVIEEVIPMAENSDALLQTISTNLSKADKMYLQILDMENAVRIEKEINEERSKELDKKEVWLKDRQNMLTRSTKEVQGK